MQLIKKIAPYFFAYLITNIVFVCGYTFLNWHFLIKPQAHFIATDLSDFWFPFILPPLLIFIVFYFMLRAVQPAIGNLILIGLTATAGISPAVIIAQHDIKTATGKLTTLENINEINQHPTTKYYKLNTYYVDKYYSGSFSCETSNRRSFDYTIFIACPILLNPEDTLQPYYTCWLTMHYYKNFGAFDESTISNREEGFWQESITDFEKRNVNSSNYLEALEHDFDYKNFEMAAHNSSKYSSSTCNYFFKAPTFAYEQRSGYKGEWLIAVFLAEQLALGSILYFLMKYLLKTGELK